MRLPKIRKKLDCRPQSVKYSIKSIAGSSKKSVFSKKLDSSTRAINKSRRLTVFQFASNYLLTFISCCVLFPVLPNETDYNITGGLFLSTLAPSVVLLASNASSSSSTEPPLFDSSSDLISSTMMNSTESTSSTTTLYQYDGAEMTWLMACVAITWIMIPGVGFLYNGLARSKSSLSIIMLCLWCCAVVSVQVCEDRKSRISLMLY
jgi:hypothetical protein